jgi:hypothetical protein
MRRVRLSTVVTISFLALTAAVSPANASGVARARVQVRVYDTTVMLAADQTVALRAAAGVLAAAGIDVTWVMCGEAGSGNPRVCDVPIGRSEVAVRLVRLPGVTSYRGELELGYSLVDTTAAAGALATIYVDRVQWLAAQSGVESPFVIGMAIAHEIGHLLLGTNKHSASGLMRAVWSRQQLQRHEATDWRFTKDQAAGMVRAMRDREMQMASNIIWGE